MSGDLGSRLTPRLVIGLAIVVLGVLFLLDNLHVLDAHEFVRYWPVVFIVIGLLKVIQPQIGSGIQAGVVVALPGRQRRIASLTSPSRVGGLFWIVLGLVLLANQLDLMRLRFRDLVPIFLLLGGGYLVWQALLGRKAPSSVVTDSGSRVSSLAFMSGVERKVVTDDFHGGEATALMGGVEIDLRNATIVDGPAVMDLLACMGGIELRVPENWRVTGKVLPIMGGFEDSTRTAPGVPTKELIVKGIAFMGGVEVKN